MVGGKKHLPSFSMPVHAGLGVPERGLGSDPLPPRLSSSSWAVLLLPPLRNWAKSCSEKEWSRFSGIKVPGSPSASVLGESSSCGRRKERKAQG